MSKNRIAKHVQMCFGWSYTNILLLYILEVYLQAAGKFVSNNGGDSVCVCSNIRKTNNFWSQISQSLQSKRPNSNQKKVAHTKSSRLTYSCCKQWNFAYFVGVVKKVCANRHSNTKSELYEHVYARLQHIFQMSQVSTQFQCGLKNSFQNEVLVSQQTAIF